MHQAYTHAINTHSTQPTDNTLLKQELVIRKVGRWISPVLFSDKSYKIISMGNCYPVKCCTATAGAWLLATTMHSENMDVRVCACVRACMHACVRACMCLYHHNLCYVSIGLVLQMSATDFLKKMFYLSWFCFI